MIVLILGMTAGQLNCLIVQRLGSGMARLFVSWHAWCMVLSIAGAVLAYFEGVDRGV